jgi:hypothetical protein
MRRLHWLFLLAPLVPSSAFGWGCEGHQMVALIARAHLTPLVSSAMDTLLQSSPIDPALNRFCKDRPADPMADAATWADDVKSTEKTGVWHYVDIPRTAATGASLDPWCPAIGPSVNGKDRPGCIVNALELELGILRDKARSGTERATALGYIIHLVGDIHQPLHVEDNNDVGGNCTAMQFFADAKPVNLHAIWDYRLIEHQMEAENLTDTAYAAALNARFAAKFASVSAAKAFDPVSWAWESHAIGEGVVYGELEPRIPVHQPDPQSVCSAEREKVQAMNIRIGDDYFAKAIPVIDEQVATAGFRLATLLNDAMKQDEAMK